MLYIYKMLDEYRYIHNVSVQHIINDVVSLDTNLPGCFYNSIYNSVDKYYSTLNNQIDRNNYILHQKYILIGVLETNIHTLANGMYLEIKDEECSLDKLKNDIISGANVGYELLPLLEYYFDVNIYIVDINTCKKINICSIDRTDRNCIVLGYGGEHFTSIALEKEGRYMTNFSYNNNFVNGLRDA